MHKSIVFIIELCIFVFILLEAHKYLCVFSSEPYHLFCYIPNTPILSSSKIWIGIHLLSGIILMFLTLDLLYQNIKILTRRDYFQKSPNIFKWIIMHSLFSIIILINSHHLGDLEIDIAFFINLIIIFVLTFLVELYSIYKTERNYKFALIILILYLYILTIPSQITFITLMRHLIVNM